MTASAGWLFVAVASFAHPQQPDSRKAPPDAASQKGAEKQVRDLFKDEYLKTNPGEKALLARKLAELAAQTKDDAVTQYVLYREARDLFASAGEGSSAFEAIDSLGKLFVIDPIRMKSVVLGAAGLEAGSPQGLKALCNSYMNLAEEAIRGEDLEGAEKAAGNAVVAAKRAQDLLLSTKAESKLKEIGELKKKFALIRKARGVLSKTPGDPEANFVIGQYLCIAKGDWENGLGYLAKGLDGALRTNALKEIGKPTESAAQIALGDAWWDLGEKESESTKASLRRRAAFWYQQALPSVAGLTRTKLEKRLDSVPKEPGQNSRSIDLIRMIDPVKESRRGQWKKEGSIITTPPSESEAYLQIPYIPPEEYDIRLVVVRKQGNGALNVGLAMQGRSFLVSFDGWDGTTGGIDAIDGKFCNSNETSFKKKMFQDDTARSVVCSIRKGSILVTVDGNEEINWKSDHKRLSLPPQWNPLDQGSLFLMEWNSLFEIREITLTPVSGEGKRLR
jgi:hypothetical protein